MSASSLKNFSNEDKAKYRDQKILTAYDRRTLAANIVKKDYDCRNPHSRLSVRDGICSCGKPITHGDIFLRLDDKGHEHHNHKSCKSWACPVCAPIRAYERANDIEKVITAANSLDMKQFFITFTVPHKSSHSSNYVISHLYKCYNKLMQQRSIRALKDQYNFVGQIKCLDYTLTDNGLHAHIHAIWIFDTPEDPIHLIPAIGGEVLKRWSALVYKETHRRINQHHGFNIEYMELGDPQDPNAAHIAKYAAKSISIYCSDGDKDKGSSTPFDLLNSSSTEEDHARYLDFYKGQKGRRHIMFSRGLRARLNVDTEDTEDKNSSSAVVAHIEYEHAYFLSNANNRISFERRAASSVSSALDWLDRMTDEQQRDFSLKDPLYKFGSSNKFRSVRFADVISDLDDPLSSFQDVIRSHSNDPEDFLEELEKIEILRRDLKEENARDRLQKNLERLKKNARRRSYSSSSSVSARPLSGLGAALALADKNAPRPAPFDDDLFF